MKKYFLDTSFLIDLIRKGPSALKIHEKIKGREVTGTVCMYELSKFSKADFGKLLGDKEILEFSKEDARASGGIYRHLKKKGIKIGEINTIIAGIVTNRGLVLVTRDSHFRKVPGIEIIFYKV